MDNFPPFAEALVDLRAIPPCFALATLADEAVSQHRRIPNYLDARIDDFVAFNVDLAANGRVKAC